MQSPYRTRIGRQGRPDRMSVLWSHMARREVLAPDRCPQGHLLKGANLVWKTRRVWICRICHAKETREWARRKRAGLTTPATYDHWTWKAKWKQRYRNLRCPASLPVASLARGPTLRDSSMVKEP